MSTCLVSAKSSPFPLHTVFESCWVVVLFIGGPDIPCQGLILTAQFFCLFVCTVLSNMSDVEQGENSYSTLELLGQASAPYLVQTVGAFLKGPLGAQPAKCSITSPGSSSI